MYNQLPKKRYAHTLVFLQKHIPKESVILDLGVKNPFTEIMESNGYTVYNTEGEDLDVLPEIVKKYKVDVVTAFEIFEHLLAPFNVLREIEATKIVTTIPLKLWFAHEFEDWQYDWLLEKSGWEIQDTERWTSPIKKIGFRPILRKYTPRYYAVYATKKNFE